MSSLKQLRNRVRSINSTQKITKAMQVVSAAKLKKIKDRADQLDFFSQSLAEIMQDIACGKNILELSENDRIFFQESQQANTDLIVVMTSERGLCGGVNAQILREVRASIKQAKKENRSVKLIVVGKKGYDGLKGKYSDIIADYLNITLDNIDCIATLLREAIIKYFQTGEIGRCYIYYNEFKNAMTQIMTKLPILPIIQGKFESQNLVEQNFSEKNVAKYEYEGYYFFRDLINLYISGLIHYTMLQSRASEEGGRMSAMDNATRNAGELIDKLTLQLNRSRQAIITTELTEIISGAESV